MLLYLLRHAEAATMASSDYQRPLTPKGQEQARHLGEFCYRMNLMPDLILASPVLRARQTAEVMASYFPKTPCHEVPWAACGMSPIQALEELQSWQKFPSILLVGHQPDLGYLAATLLSISRPQALRIRKGLFLGIETGATLRSDVGELQFFLPVSFLQS